MKKTTVKGMMDYLPNEVAVRDYIQQEILNSYLSNGFVKIETPIVESLENLDNSNGGDNLKLMYKIAKRGVKLEEAIQKQENFCDLGLRYDLTLPLVRYIANNKDLLVFPFKCIQIGSVYRAERPQKGRMCEFTQCDIDIIGDNSVYSEIELITVTVKALQQLNIGDFTVKINNRRILNLLLLYVGFLENELNTVCVSVDKMDKIGEQGVRDDLQAKGLDREVINRLFEYLQTNTTIESLKTIVGNSDDIVQLQYIIDSCNRLLNDNCKVEFDLTLVRGQGYYTGTVFEIISKQYNGVIAGGGRYDDLIGKFSKQSISACGFSIGFERVYSILRERQINKEKKAIIYFCDKKDYVSVYTAVENLRKVYNVTVYQTVRNMNVFLEKMKNIGFAGYMYDEDKKIRWFK